MEKSILESIRGPDFFFFCIDAIYGNVCTSSVQDIIKIRVTYNSNTILCYQADVHLFKVTVTTLSGYLNKYLINYE